jgi:hypothetical protein
MILTFFEKETARDGNATAILMPEEKTTRDRRFCRKRTQRSQRKDEENLMSTMGKK